VLKALEALAPDHGRPVVLLGERGQGKSHLLAVLYHALSDAPATESWLQTWAERLSNPKIGQLKLRRGMRVIGESLHRQRYRYIWDLLFERHPEGKYIRGKWEGATTPATDLPSDRLILEMLEKQPTALLLDEFQVWYDGLTNTKQYPWRTWASSFAAVRATLRRRLLMLTLHEGILCDRELDVDSRAATPRSWWRGWRSCQETSRRPNLRPVLPQVCSPFRLICLRSQADGDIIQERSVEEGLPGRQAGHPALGRRCGGAAATPVG
jgi:hypothetical protein